MKRFLKLATTFCLFSAINFFPTINSSFVDLQQSNSEIHNAHKALLLQFSRYHDNIDELSSLAASRTAHMTTLMLTNANEALRLSDNLFESYSNHPHFNVLQKQGLIEKKFSSSKVDLTYACGMRHMEHEATRHSPKHFCEESLYKYDDHRSYKVNIPSDFPIRKYWTHKNLHLSGYTLNDASIIHPPSSSSHSHLQAVPDYKQPQKTGVDSQRPLSLLLISITFDDLPNPPATQKDLEIMRDETAAYFASTSYGQSTITSTTFTPPVQLLQSSTYFGDYNKLSVDATEKARQMDPTKYDGDKFDLIVWLFTKLNGFAWAGLGYVGIKGVWDNGYVPSQGQAGFGVKVMCHELGHNFGFAHASAWKVTDGNALSPQGQDDEYGDNFDMMGYGFGIPAHYNAFYKLSVNWLSFDTEATSCGRSCPEWRGLIYPSDSPLSRTFINAVDVVRSNDQPNGDHYWLSTKSLWDRDQLGLFIHTSSGNYGIPKVYLLNMHLEWNNGKDVKHAALQIGETYSDCSQNIHISNIGFDACPKAASAVKCVNTVVKRITSSGPVLTISVTGAPQKIAADTPFTVTATTSEQATVSWNFVKDTYTNIVGSTVTYSYPKATNGYQQVMVQATDLQGKFTRYYFTIAVGDVTGLVPIPSTTTDALGYTFTCSAGKTVGYSGSSSSGTSATWFQGGFGACSATCGGGVSSQSVTCRLNGEIVPDIQCKSTKPIDKTSCNTGACDSFVWIATAYTECSKKCDGGVKTRTASCQVATSSTLTIGSVVDSSLCSAKPAPVGTIRGVACNFQLCTVGGAANRSPDGSKCLYSYGGSNCDEVPSVRVLEPSGLLLPGQSTQIKFITTGSATTASIALYGPASIWPIYIARKATITNSFYKGNTTINSFTWNPSVDDPQGAYYIKITLNSDDGYDPSAGGLPSYTGESPSFTVQNLCKTIGVTCYYGGRCLNGQCACNNGATSYNCDPCDGNNCNNGKGVCSSYPETFGQCVGCIGGYVGIKCERAPGCGFSCSNGGLVNANCDSCTCLTTSNYTGPHCDTCGLKCGAYGKANAGCTACECMPGWYTGPISDAAGAQCSLSYVEVTLKIGDNISNKIDRSNFNSTIDITNFKQTIAYDIAYALEVGVAAIHIKSATWVDQSVYVVVWLKQLASAGAVSPTKMLSNLQASINSNAFKSGFVAATTDANYGVKNGDQTPQPAESFLNSTMLIYIGIAIAAIILIVIIVCVVRYKKRRKAAGFNDHMTKEIHLAGRV